MARYETYRSNAAEIPVMRRWVIRGLIMSLLIHAGLFAFFQFKRIDNFSLQSVATLSPPKFVVQQAKIDEMLLRDTGDTKIERLQTVPRGKIEVPEERPVAKEIELKPQIKEVTSPLLTEKVAPKPLNWDAITKTDAISAG